MCRCCFTCLWGCSAKGVFFQPGDVIKSESSRWKNRETCCLFLASGFLFVWFFFCFASFYLWHIHFYTISGETIEGKKMSIGSEMRNLHSGWSTIPHQLQFHCPSAYSTARAFFYLSTFHFSREIIAFSPSIPLAFILCEVLLTPH